MTLSEKILRLRTARGLSQGELAEKLEVSRQSVSKWETGQSTPDVDKIIKLADLFGVTTDYLLREQREEEPQPQEQDIPMVRTDVKKLDGVRVCGIVLAFLGLLLTALAAVSASQGQMGHIELIFVLLLILPGAVLTLGAKHNLLAAAWTLCIGSAALWLLGDTSMLLWLKKFYLMFFLGDTHSSVSISVAPLRSGGLSMHMLMFCILAMRTRETWKTEIKNCEGKQDG